MVNSPLIRPYFLGGVALGEVARIPMIIGFLEGGSVQDRGGNWGTLRILAGKIGEP